MAIRIGHSSIDENRKAKGGKAGDQTGKEVCIRSWYSKPWEFVLRCIDPDIAEGMARTCEAGCANDCIGYDQGQRNTLYTQAKAVGFDLSKITTACECDCSSFMTVCAIANGVPIDYGTNAPRTATMKAVFMKTGMFDVLTDSKYLKSDAYLKRGDILVKAASHTVMALDNGSKATSVPELAKPVLRKGSKGTQVKNLQSDLNHVMNAGLSVDGDFGSKTYEAVKAFQKKYMLTIDGIYGYKSHAQMKSVLK